MIIILPLLVALVGMLMYVLSSKPPIAEIGRIMFAFGLLVALLLAGPETFTFLRGR